MLERGLDASCTGFTLQNADAPDAVETVAWRPYGEILDLKNIVWGCYTSPGATLVCRRSLLVEIGGYDSSFKRYEDWDLLLRIVTASSGGLGFLPHPLAAIYTGMNFKPAMALDGLNRMWNKHRASLAEKGFLRQFRSAILFNRAAIHKADKKLAGTACDLLRSLLLHPMGHDPLKILLRK